MQILVNHLTRMHGGHVCVAGIDLASRRHVRPVLPRGPMPFYFLVRYGGPFDMGRVVDLGSPRPQPERPHIEDCVYVPSHAKLQRCAEPYEFWNYLYVAHKPRLREIFGAELRPVGSSLLGTDVGCGQASLGCLRPAAPPKLYLRKDRDGRQQVRMTLCDGDLEADARVTDLRLVGDDHATVDVDRVRGVAKWIFDSQDVILSVGLTRKYRPSERHPYVHYLQVNNVHLKEEPTWQLG